MSVRVLIPLVLALAAAVYDAAPLEAQTAVCTRERHREPRRRPAEVRRDSIREHARTAIREDLVRAAREAGVAPEGLVLLEHEVRGGAGRMWMGQGSIPQRVLTSVYERARPLLASYPDAPRGRVSMHLRLDPLPMDSVRVGDVVTECRPNLLNAPEIRLMVQEFTRRQPRSAAGPAAVRALVARDGEVLEVELARSSGSLQADDFALELFRRMRFAPATLNGVPMDVWVEQPVVVR